MTEENRPAENNPAENYPAEPELDGAADAWVRDLLAEARATGPVPDDVAARLDETLAALQAERLGGAGDRAGEPATVVPLRRRLAPLLAAAAAVLVVAGGAVGVTRLGRDGGASSENAAGAVSADAGSSPAAPADREPAGITATSLPRLGRATFARDAAAVMRTLALDATSSPKGSTGTTPDMAAAQPQADAAATGVAPPVTTTPAPEALVAPVAACPGPQVTGGVTVPAVLDQTPVALVFRPPTDTGQRVEAWSCDGATLLASATVPH